MEWSNLSFQKIRSSPGLTVAVLTAKRVFPSFFRQNSQAIFAYLIRKGFQSRSLGKIRDETKNKKRRKPRFRVGLDAACLKQGDR